MTTKNKTCECSFCGEHSPVRLLDRYGYAPDEFICEECFSDDYVSWDDLPEVKEEA